jgi:hypothetical protein
LEHRLRRKIKINAKINKYMKAERKMIEKNMKIKDSKEGEKEGI